MRLTIFWRIMLAQSALIAIIVLVSLYSFSQFDRLTQVTTYILAVGSPCVLEEKRLLKIFLGEMRNAEKYLISLDKDFYANFRQGKADLATALERISTLVDTDQEKDLAAQIQVLHTQYEEGVESATKGNNSWEKTKGTISDGIIEKANELIRVREQIIVDETTAARDRAAEAATMIAWLSLSGITLALLLAYINARSVSRPLDKLAREMHRMARGKPTRNLVFRAPPEVLDLARTFCWMTEEMTLLDRLKADFTAHVSHELRTPLTAIREGTSLLLEEVPGPLTQSQREILEVLGNHSERLFRTISSILDLSKMEAEMMEYEMTACDLSSLIYKSVETVRLIARSRRVNLYTILDDQLPIVHIDERRIQQVLDNLLSNALKFTPEGGEVRIAASPKSGGNKNADQVEVRVTDTGSGIPEAEREKVFARFYQSAQDSGKKKQGTGLGLAIAHHIIQAHRGRIWVESEPGKGSTFVFALPLASKEEKPQT